MARPTFSSKVLVLKRTKLGESDVICTFLNSDGSQLRAVAKGARKPTSAFSARLELFSVCNVLFAQGKNLDIVKEAQLVEPNLHLKSDITLFESACPVLEFLEKTTQVGLAVPKLFDLSTKTLQQFKQASEEHTLSITAAFLLKALAFLGFRPSFAHCVYCEEKIDLSNPASRHAFSSYDGGVVCSACLLKSQTTFVFASSLACANVLLYSTFEQIVSLAFPNEISTEVLQIISDLLVSHMGIKLKSLRYISVHGHE